MKLLDVWMLFSMLYTFLGVILHALNHVMETLHFVLSLTSFIAFSEEPKLCNCPGKSSQTREKQKRTVSPSSNIFRVNERQHQAGPETVTELCGHHSESPAARHWSDLHSCNAVPRPHQSLLLRVIMWDLEALMYFFKPNFLIKF